MSATHVERRGPIAVVTLDNPPVNGLGSDVRAGLEAAFDELLPDPGVLAAEHGAWMAPAPLLERLAREEKRLEEI